MKFNASVAAGLGFIPVVGDFALAAWKGNWRNANLLEDCAYITDSLGEESQRKYESPGGGTANCAAPRASTSCSRS